MLHFFKLAVIGMITVPAALATIIIGLFDPYGKHAYVISRIWTWMILTVAGVSLKVNGLNHIDPKRQYIFIANHQSNIDIPVLIQSLPGFQLRWIAKRELLRIPLFGWAMWAAKHITVNRSNRAEGMAILKKAQQRMRGGISLVIFPEGTRSMNGRPLPFKRGGLLLALKTQAAIVPVTINGSGKILAKGDWRIRRGIIEVTVGEPISVENYRRGTLRGLSAKVYAVITESLWPVSESEDEASGEFQPIVASHSSLGQPNLMRK
jgi:1-acyl-sn-glycerol-3-phosphate acyltransferase